MMYAVITYANMRGIRSIDRIVDLCERDIAFIRLTQGRKPKRDAFYEFKGKKLTSDILDNLNYQFMRRLQKEGLVTLKELFIDGTKIEDNANRYTFVWRGSINYHPAVLLDSIDKLYSNYNSFLQDNSFSEKYGLGNAQMFVIDGIDKVRDVIEKNRKRKITKYKKLSNNRIIEIDNCSPIEILKLQKNLMAIADGGEEEIVMIDAITAYNIMNKHISKNPDDKIINCAITKDAYVFGVKEHPDCGEMAVDKNTGEVYIMSIIDYAECVESGDVHEIDINTLDKS